MFSSSLARVVSVVRDALRNEKGGMGAFMAVGILASIGFIGLSVDAIRGYLIQSRLSSALDAAGLAGARVMFSPTRDADIQMYFDANFPAGYLGATVTGPTFSVNGANEILTLSATAAIDTSFMRLFGFDTLNVAASSEITRQTDFLDVVLAMDMSGSMSGSRITDARAAATELVNILFGADELKALLKIGLVPWSGKVNVTLRGTTFDSALTTSETVSAFINPIVGSTDTIYHVNNSPVPLLEAPPADWEGCVFARYTHNSTQDDADLMVGPTTVPISGVDWPAWEPTDPDGEPVSPGVCVLSTNGNECTSCISEGITPLQSTKTGIQTAIDALTSPGGWTNAVAGLGWAWRVLMPAAPFTEADPNPQGRRTQAIVLLTDGEQTGANGDAYKAVFGLSGDARAGGQDQRLKDLADAIKAQGVLIYTIQFANTSGPLADLMKYVASSPEPPFYNQASSANLSQVFKEIANDLSQLRVSM